MRECKRMAMGLSLACTVLLTGCKTDTQTVKYSLSITNLTRGQPLSPPAVILHRSGYQAFAVGTEASLGVERLAEAGDNHLLLARAKGDKKVDATASGDAGIAPGSSESVVIQADVDRLQDLAVSYLSMLGNTNDGFASVHGAALGSLKVGQQIVLAGHSYDAGTEANTESADTVPGPAATGGAREGFNPARDDIVNEVRRHSGVVSRDDGLAGAALTQAQRWDDPVVRITITRIE